MDLLCILGPTASGKTQLAVRVAQALGGEIISADSRQVYRDMDVGTGKDRSALAVPCHLIDIVPAGEKYNLFRYQQDFETVYRSLRARRVPAILCGGSGMYIEAVCRGFVLPEVPANKALRASLEGKSPEELKALLASFGPLHNTTDVKSPQRAIRAIEIADYRQRHFLAEPPAGQGSGAVPAAGLPAQGGGAVPAAGLPAQEGGAVPAAGLSAQGGGSGRNRPLDVLYVGIDPGRELRRERISRRLHKRLEEEGMIREVEGLLNRGLRPEQLLYYGLEYKYVTLYLLGKLTYEQLFVRLETAIHRFAKRQMTWFRGMERRGIVIEWLDGRLETEVLAAQVLEKVGKDFYGKTK